MAFQIDQFRSQLQYDGARPNLFDVTITLPPGLGSLAAAQKLTFMVNATQLPGFTTGVVPLFYFGREVKLAGNRVFPDWIVTVINDEDFLCRNAFETWSNAINSLQGNTRNPAFLSNLGYSTNITVTQYGKSGNTIKQYTLIGAFPNDISPIDLSWSALDQIEEYQVSFNYQYLDTDTTS